jgi:8-oxo-dGTP pyrophosphatase MutT (NUDIX family)
MKQIKMKIDGKIIRVPYFLGVDDEAPRDDFATEERHSVIAIIENRETGEYLCVDARKRACKSFVMGGIEDDETPEQAALREVTEETGYDDVKIDSVDKLPLINHFFAEYKEVNRYAYLKIVHGHLKTDSRQVVSTEEQIKQTTRWISRDDLLNFLDVEMCRWAARKL